MLFAELTKRFAFEIPRHLGNEQTYGVLDTAVASQALCFPMNEECNLLVCGVPGFLSTIGVNAPGSVIINGSEFILESLYYGTNARRRRFLILF